MEGGVEIALVELAVDVAGEVALVEFIRKMTFGPKATWVISTFPKQLGLSRTL